MNTKFKWPLAEKDIDVFSTEVKRGIETLYATCTDNVVNDALCRANLAQQVSQLLTSYIDLRLIFKFHIICDSTNNVEPLNATPVLDVVFNIEQHGRITKPRVTLSFKQKSMWIK